MANPLVVLAGREPPPLAWRADPGWQQLFRAVALRNLSPLESDEYLDRSAVPIEQRRRVLDFTHGHPLALSLVADLFAQRPDVSFQPEEAIHNYLRPDRLYNNTSCWHSMVA